MVHAITTQTLQRLPTYLNYLKTVKSDNISSKAIADALGLGEIQVRKDLAEVSSGGKPKIGYVTDSLISDLENYLGYSDINDAVLVGAGKLGRALMSYEGFKEYGLNIVSAFDSNTEIIDSIIDGKCIFSIEKLHDICERMKVRIGIITVPAENAQKICDEMVKSGVLAIWNFAPVHLEVPDDVLVKNENMAVSLAVLSKHLKEKLTNDIKTAD